MTNQEIDILRTIVNEYADIDEKMRANEEILKKISHEQIELMDRLEKNEDKEKDFLKTLHKKYPDFSLTDLLNYL